MIRMSMSVSGAMERGRKTRRTAKERRMRRRTRARAKTPPTM